VPDDDLLLPSDAVLVHVGPYKTGTTALQTSLHTNRPGLAAAGVTYPGITHRHMRPSWALLGRSRLGHPVVPMSEWDELVAEVRASPGRVMLSSEDFSSASPEQARTLVDDLGRDRVRLLFVVRRLDKLLPSAWQERVKSVNDIRSYDEWLREVLTQADSGAAHTFWGHQSVRTQLELWTRELPLERVTLVVADESDHGMLRRVCERMLGLPPSTLSEASSPNTSLSWERAELVRAVNRGVRDGRWTERLHRRLVFRGLVSGLQHAPRRGGETAIPPVPAWARERVRELSRTRADEVAGSGARVVGDPLALLLPPQDLATTETSPAEPTAVPTAVPIEAAVAGLEELLQALDRRERRRSG
jgi:hypothetical protein